MEHHFKHVVGGFGGNWVWGGFGVLVYWGIDDIEHLDLCHSFSGCIRMYELGC